MRREDDFTTRRTHLANMDDEQLKNYFWELAGKVVDPLLEMGYEYTSPSIERSVLLRMGFSSLEVKPIVDGALLRNILSYGAGNLIYRLAKDKDMSIRDAGLALAEGQLWDDVVALFKEGA